ncbi:pyruvate kinase [Paenibacillus sp. TRM 82003]|nr:pyruvate kinase [Paenibacillus sp. TRM 82003]
MKRKTKILCTLGPACDSVETLREMMRAGMTAARLNMAHGELEEHADRIRRVREAADGLGLFVPVLMDIKGPEIRIGKLKVPYVELEPDETIVLTTEPIEGDRDRVAVSYQEMPSVLREGSTILIDDGQLELTVVKIDGGNMTCRIVNGGKLKPRKGVNLPGVRTTLPGVTERDVAHLEFGVRHGVDIIAVSFVRRGADILEVKRLLKEHGAGHVQVVSKIENEEGVASLDEIIEASDGIMVARGDLGVEIPIEDVPLVQREMIEKCNRAGKPVIVATHMLDSMQANPRPTRAEVSDVAAAVLQGADVVMLSVETAAGKYPIPSVATMAAVAEKAEGTIDYREAFAARKRQGEADVTEIVSQAVVGSSLEIGARAIVTSTESSFTARMISKYRPEAPILAVTQHRSTLPSLALLRGVVPVLGDPVATTDEMFDSAVKHAGGSGLVAKGDYLVITAGVPLGKAGTTNLMKLVQL